MALVAVTDHAVERYGQRVRGTLDPRTEIAARVGGAIAAGRVERASGARSSCATSAQPSLVYVCMEDRPRGELIVVEALWNEEGEDAAVPASSRTGLRRAAGADARATVQR